MACFEACSGHEHGGLTDEVLRPVISRIQGLLRLDHGRLRLGSQLCQDGTARKPRNREVLERPCNTAA